MAKSLVKPLIKPLVKHLRAPLRIDFVTAAAGAGTREAPYGAATVASALAARPDFAGRISISIIESLPDDVPAEIAAQVLARRPQVVGFSVYSWNRGKLGAVAGLIRDGLPSALFVAGGPETSADPEGILAEGLGDIAVAGEGESAMADIVASALKLQNGSLPGASVRDIPESGSILRSPLLDLAGLVSPWLDGTLDPARWGGAAMELARGCPFRCAFCFDSKGSAIGTKGDAIGRKGDARVRRFPLERIAAELDKFRSSGIQEVFVLDPTFNADGTRMAEAVRLMTERGKGLRFVLELRAELLDRNQAKMLAGLDCSVQIGLQSSDPAVLVKVDRSFDPAVFARKVRLLEEYGVVYGLDLIYGLPGDNLAGFFRSLDYALALGPNHLDVFRLAVLPGTTLSERAKGLGLVYDPLAPHLVHSTPDFSAAELARADKIALAMDLLYNRGRAVLWFPALTRALGMKASAVIEAFADSEQARDLVMEARSAADPGLSAESGSAAGSGSAVPGASHREIETGTIRFFTQLFGNRAKQGSKARTGAGEAAVAKAGIELAKAGTELIRASGAWTRALAEGEITELSLDWNPEDLMNYAAADLRRFAAEFDKSPGHWICAPGREGPHFARQKARRS
jgi:radical SAM superfamily enzyme YgiQ (UPF0313 family)